MLFGAAAPVGAQFSSPVSPGSLGQTKVSTKESVDAAIESARWHVGPLRLAPWMSIDEISYNDNVFGTQEGRTSDVKTSVSLGLHGHVPFGPKVVLGLVALPTYTWWSDLEELRDWNYTYGAGLFGYFNKLTVEVTAVESKTQQIQAPQFGPPADETRRQLAAAAEVALLGRLAAFATGSHAQIRFDEPGDADLPDIDFSGLDRDEDIVTAGLRYRWSSRVALGLGIQASEVAFEQEERDRSNSGEGGILDLQLGFGELDLNLSYGNIRLKPTGASRFQAYDGLVGTSSLHWRGGTGWEAALYGGRSLSFGYTLSSATEDVRYGVNVSFPLGWRLRLGGYAEQGTITYLGVLGTSQDRAEDVETYGADANIKISGWTVRAGLSTSEYVGTANETNRKITTVTIALSLPGAFQSWW
jgi:hypothetical protein